MIVQGLLTLIFIGTMAVNPGHLVVEVLEIRWPIEVLCHLVVELWIVSAHLPQPSDGKRAATWDLLVEQRLDQHP